MYVPCTRATGTRTISPLLLLLLLRFRVQDPFPGVEPKAELARGLAALNSKMGGKVMPMLQQMPPEAANKLQTYFQAAGVRLQ